MVFSAEILPSMLSVKIYYGDILHEISKLITGKKKCFKMLSAESFTLHAKRSVSCNTII